VKRGYETFATGGGEEKNRDKPAQVDPGSWHAHCGEQKHEGRCGICVGSKGVPSRRRTYGSSKLKSTRGRQGGRRIFFIRQRRNPLTNCSGEGGLPTGGARGL